MPDLPDSKATDRDAPASPLATSQTNEKGAVTDERDDLAVAEGCIKRLAGDWFTMHYDDGRMEWWHASDDDDGMWKEPATDAEVECMRKVME